MGAESLVYIAPCSKCSGQTCNNAVPAVFDVDEEEPEVTSLETDDEDD